MEVVYAVTLPVIKISILLLYRVLFPTRFFRIGFWVLGTLSLVWGVAVLFVVIFQCKPVSAFWDPAEGNGTTCISTEEFFYSIAPFNIATDVAILCLPVREVWKLQMPFKRRVATFVMFLLGGLYVFFFFLFPFPPFFF